MVHVAYLLIYWDVREQIPPEPILILRTIECHLKSSTPREACPPSSSQETVFVPLLSEAFAKLTPGQSLIMSLLVSSCIFPSVSGNTDSPTTASG